MATYDDYDGVYFSIQALRMFHPICSTDSVEFVILDNNPSSEHGKVCKSFIENHVKGKYIPYNENPTTFNKYKIVDYATGKYILIIDCHVLIYPEGVDYLLHYFHKNENCKDLIQGPLLHDRLKRVSTHFEPIWGKHMYGKWATDQESYDKGQPFEIPMQGMGLLAFEKTAWKGINQNFRGFGGEEGYIAEKFRGWGGKNICLPQLKWVHRFGRPNGIKYPNKTGDRLWNYLIGWLEITKDPNSKMVQDIRAIFKDKLSDDEAEKIFLEAKKETGIIL